MPDTLTHYLLYVIYILLRLVSLGYTYYDSSQSFGALRGNAVRLSTDWKF